MSDLTRVKDTLNFGFKEVTTHRVPLGMRFFHPSGLSARAEGRRTSIKTVSFSDWLGVCRESGEDDFWIVDAAISYRLPKRYGFITVGATNLFDQKFKFQEADFDNATIQPDRMLFGRVTLAFP